MFDNDNQFYGGASNLDSTTPTQSSYSEKQWIALHDMWGMDRNKSNHEPRTVWPQ